MRHGRGFPLGTQYQSLWRTVPSNPLSGSGSMSLTGAGSLTVVAGTIFESAAPAEHRFRSVQVPELADLEAVQRHLQRNLDEIARAVNPIRSIPDGGTGLVEVTAGALMYGTGSESMATLPPGTPGQVLGLVAGLPAWVAAGAGAGEANTASNVNTGGQGVFKQKTLVNLEFRGISVPAASSIVVTLDAANNEIELALSGDSAAPGNTKLYGTNGAGAKGWYAQPAGSGISGTKTVDFGAFPGVAEIRVAVADAAVTAPMLLRAWPLSTSSTADHTGDEHSIEDFDTNVENLNAGVGFDLVVRPRVGTCFGQYKFAYTGV